MDAFIYRKRQRASPPPNDIEDPSSLTIPDDDESTDFKLAMMASLHPHLDQQTLLDILLANDGSIEAASACLVIQEEQFQKKSSIVPGIQTSLATFATSGESSSKKAKLLSKKGKTLHLYSPEDVVAQTPCSIIHNFLPADEANALLQELLKESETFEKMTFKLFDNVVSSPHTASLYVESLEEKRRQQIEYLYNGANLTDVRQISPLMRQISVRVKEAVNKEVAARISSHYPNGKKLRYQSPDPWAPNAAMVNCYNGGSESVGYHSDQLTYLGPRAIIGSLSLGVAREFRVRRAIPTSLSSPTTNSIPSDTDAAGQISIHLPHNSLLVMHAEMQEEWKHSIAPAPAIDPHLISGNKRINITYRNYKTELHPRFTPKCHCGISTVLRVVQRKKENLGRYFWMCHAGNVPGKEGCSFFQWADFDDDGKPVWKRSSESSRAISGPSDKFTSQ